MLSEWLVGRYGNRTGDTGHPDRGRIGALEGWVSVVVNLAVFVVKLVPGLLIGSISLVADAVHSLGDVLSSGIVIWSFHASARPPDREHPFGHGRIESVASLVIAVLLVVASIEFAKTSVASLLHPRAVEASLVLLAALVLTVVVKEWLARFSRRLSRRIESTALEADAWHHHSDAFATGVVIVALAGERFDIRWLDGAAGLVVAAFIAWAGVALIRRSLDPLLGEAPTKALQKQIRELAVSVPEVESVHDVMVHAYGQLLVISLHVEVPIDLDVVAAHEVAEGVEKLVAERVGAVVVVHVDPVDRNHPLYAPVEAFLAEITSDAPGIREFHDLRIVGGEQACNVVFDIALEGVDTAGAKERLSRALKARFPQVVGVAIEVEPTLAF